MNGPSTLSEKTRWLGFPGIIRAIVMLQWVGFALVMIRPEIIDSLSPDPIAIWKDGQFWRIFSWIFLPPILPFPSPVFAALFLLIMTRISFMFSDGLESVWGIWKTSIYVYSCIICISIALLILPFGGYGSGLLYLLLFFAFAAWFPDVEFALFFIIPVKIRILAPLAAIMVVFGNLPSVGLFVYYFIFNLVAFLPFLIWFGIRMFKNGRTKVKVAHRRAKFQNAAAPKEQALHCCHVCNRTELSNPELSFRVAENGEEYCLDHLDSDGKPLAP